MAYSNNNNNNSNNSNNRQQRNNDEVRFEIEEHIAVLGCKENGWTKEVNVVAWNGGAAKVDVREWDPTHVRMSRGITLFEEEAEKLARALADRYGLEYEEDAAIAFTSGAAGAAEAKKAQASQAAQA